MLAVSFYENVKTTYRKFQTWTCFCHNLNLLISLYNVKEVMNLSGSIKKKGGEGKHSILNLSSEVFLLPLVLYPKPPKPRSILGKH